MGATITFKRPDGGEAQGYLANASRGDAAGLVVIQEWWGLSEQIKAMVDRFALAGFDALAPDLFKGVVVPYHDADAASKEMMSLDFMDATSQTVRGAAQYLKRNGAKVGITGFCMGGGYAYLAAVSGVDVDAAVSFYGGGIAEQLGDPYCPLLCFFGGRDEWIPRESIVAVEQHHPGLVKVYEDAGHGFIRDGSDSYDEAAATDAWARLLEFFGAHLQLPA